MSNKKYFGTDGIRGRVGDYPITPDFVLKLGWAAGKVFSAKFQSSHPKVIIGKDTRISGYMFESALEAGLSAAGVNIELLGPMPTPAIAYLTRTLRAQAGIVISASHNPYYDNGIKFFSADGCKLPDDVELAIEEALEQPMSIVDNSLLGKATRINDAQGRYIEFCKSTISNEVSLNHLKIVIDCAQGATYHVAPYVFRELGAEVVELSVNPDGFNINEACGATDLKMLQKIVPMEKADLGIAFDGDGDRVMMIDHKGNIVDGDEIIYIIMQHLIRSNQKPAGIVGTLMSNLGLENACRDLGIDFIRAKVGDRYVMSELHQAGWRLGGENSGHIVCLDKTTTGDGIVAALQVLQAMFFTSQSLADLRKSYQKYPQVLINVCCKEKIDLNSSTAIQETIKAANGILGKHGRLLLRASGTEPLIRVMVEADDKALAEKVANQVADVVKTACQ